MSTLNKILPVNNSLIDYPVKRYDRAFELASDVINENFTARTIFRVGDRFLIFEHCPQEN